LPGIQEENITVNLDRDAFTVGYDASLVTLDTMYEAIRELGYSPGLQAPEATGSDPVDDSESSPIDSALSAASQSSKLVLVDFSAEWCAACKVLEAQVFSDASVIEALQSYVFIEVDTDTYPESSKTYNVVGMPTLVILNTNGEELYRNVGLITPEEFSQILNDLIAK
jgi:thiol:disulfide interchange protein DsbD